MNRRSFLRAAAVAGAGSVVSAGAALGQEEPKNGPVQMSESAKRIELATAAGLAMQRRDWEQGIFAQAMLQSGQRELLIQLTRGAMVHQKADGRMGVVVSGGVTDPAMGGCAYAHAARWSGEREMQASVDRMLEWILLKAPRNSDGVLYHTFEAPQMW